MLKSAYPALGFPVLQCSSGYLVLWFQAVLKALTIAMRRPLSSGASVLLLIVLVHQCRMASSQKESVLLEQHSAAALLARTLSTLAKASQRASGNGRELDDEDLTAHAQHLLDTSASNQLAIKTIAHSLTPHRGDGSRFSYSASWGTLPECAAQQVCSALYVRLNRTQPLCQCSSQFKDPCSTTDYVDEHSIKLISSSDNRKAYNLVKVCEPVMSIRRCKSPQDWQLLALQSTRTGKSHYLVVCRCPTGSSLLGPIKHNNPPYANIPGIRVYGMLCSQRRSSRQIKEKQLPPVPWERVLQLARQSGLTNVTLPYS